MKIVILQFTNEVNKRSTTKFTVHLQMNTILSRLNAVFAYSVTVLAVLTALCFLSTAFKDKRADGYVETSASGIQMLVHPVIVCYCAIPCVPFTECLQESTT